MQRIRAWLGGEITRVRIREREIAVKRIHLTTLLLVLVAAVIAVVLAFTLGRYVYPYKTVPAPPVPKGQTIPNCVTESSKNLTLGDCLPQPKPTGSTNTADITSTNLGPDLSNNNPVYGTASWHGIAAQGAFAIFKVNQGTGYVDPTAKTMGDYAKGAGLVVSGYDFLDICLASPSGEADTFARALRGDGLTGPKTLPPIGDVEYPPSPACNVRAWLAAWVVEVHKDLGRWPGLYTGAWWWDPHVGSYWPAHVGFAWVSGYTGSLSSVPRPAGRSHIDLWQLSDHGFNGATDADLSQFEDGVAQFHAWTLEKAPTPKIVCWGKHSTPKSQACQKLEHQATVLWHQHIAFAKALPKREAQVKHLKGIIASLELNKARVHQDYTGPGLGWLNRQAAAERKWAPLKLKAHNALVGQHTGR